MSAPLLVADSGPLIALARLDLHEIDHPLPIVHGHKLTPERVAALECRRKLKIEK